MALRIGTYSDQVARWPAEGRHILAQFDADTIIVYQAYRSEIARWALANAHFGGRHFSYRRMSWIKPNFLWMMYRSGWASKSGQEMVLAIRLGRDFFDSILAQTVPSTYHPLAYETPEDWRRALANSSVRLQWDPDHDPAGCPLPRRALQLGLGGPVLEDYGKREIKEIIDMTPLAHEQQPHAPSGRWDLLQTPLEEVYVPASRAICERLALDSVAGDP